MIEVIYTGKGGLYFWRFFFEISMLKITGHPILDMAVRKENKKRRLGAAFFTNNTYHVPTIKNHLTDKKK